MANSTTVRAWAAQHGKARTGVRGRLPYDAIASWNETHPEDLYDSTTNVLPASPPRVFGKRSGRLPSGQVWEKTVTVSDVRAWAREHGMDVGQRGRLHPQVKEAFLSAHKTVQTV
jgi:hypothetical protein